MLPLIAVDGLATISADCLDWFEVGLYQTYKYLFMSVIEHKLI